MYPDIESVFSGSEDGKRFFNNIEKIAALPDGDDNETFLGEMLDWGNRLFQQFVLTGEERNRAAYLAFDVVPLGWAARARLRFPELSTNGPAKSLGSLPEHERSRRLTEIVEAMQATLAGIADGDTRSATAALADAANELLERFLPEIKDAPTAARWAFSVFPIAFTWHSIAPLDVMPAAGHA